LFFLTYLRRNVLEIERPVLSGLILETQVAGNTIIWLPISFFLKKEDSQTNNTSSSFYEFEIKSNLPRSNAFNLRLCLVLSYLFEKEHSWNCEGSTLEFDFRGRNCLKYKVIGFVIWEESMFSYCMNLWLKRTWRTNEISSVSDLIFKESCTFFQNLS